MRRVPLFARLPPDQQDSVGALAHQVALSRGERLGAGRGAGGRLAVVHSGRVKLVRVSAGGRERVLRVAGPGDFLGERPFLTGERPDHETEALEDTRLCTFTHDDLVSLVASRPTVALAMMRSLAERLGEAETQLALARVTGPARLASYLIDRPAVPVAEGGYRVTWPMAKRDTASYLGMTPESLSRALSRLRSAGLVRDDGNALVLTDVDALEALADS